VTDMDAQAFFAWTNREKAIVRLLHAGKLGYAEFALRRQMNYDRLMRESAPIPEELRLNRTP
jgi:3'-phosphoadenosine 5'-phosphosulfate sulfotransferase